MEDSQKPQLRNVPVDPDGIKRLLELQEQFKSRTNGGRITQTRVASLALQKLTISDLLPTAQLAAA